MANSEHLKILKTGYAAWNKWRDDHPDIVPDLSEANLSHMDLSCYDFSRADLHKCSFIHSVIVESDFDLCNLVNADFGFAFIAEINLECATLTNISFYYSTMFGAKLSFSNLTDTDFGHARLHGAKLTSAVLVNTDFHEADLTGTDMSGSDFNGSDLRSAIFNGTKLENVDFNNCIIGKTVFGSVDLKTVKGLGTLTVSAPCTIDFQTLRLSRNLPKSFLQKIGLPELYIDYLPEFYMDALTYYPVFLSHSSKNKDFARKLYEALIAKGVNVFFDEKKIKPGDDLYESLSKGIELYDKMILVCSKDSLVESWWVDREIDRLLAKERELMKERGKRINLLIPIMIDDLVFEWDGAKKEEIKRYNIGDFREWQNDEKFEKALADLIYALNVDRPDIKPRSHL